MQTNHHASRNFQRGLRWVACFLVLAIAGGRAGAQGDADLANAFAALLPSAAPQVWWHWINGNVTREGITADLQAMRRVGIGGATIVNLGGWHGNATFMSDAWMDDVQFAIREADRLGLQIGVENCGGWTSSGGPWVTPGNSMQSVVFAEQEVEGPQAFSGALPQPTTRLGYYRDIAVLAYPTPGGDKARTGSLAPKISSSDPGFEPAKLLKADQKSPASLLVPTGQSPQYVQFEYAQPFEVRTLLLALGPDSRARGTIQVSDDGQTYWKLRDFDFSPAGDQPALDFRYYGVEATSARFFRVVFTGGSSSTDGEARDHLPVPQIALQSAPAVEDLVGKADYRRSENLPGASVSVLPADLVIDPAKVIDLTARFSSTGTLAWDVPAGDWTILRFGYTPRGVTNHPAPEGGSGLEVDKLSRPALKDHWDHMMARIIARSGPLAGKTLNHTLIDSYEVGSQNWTAARPGEFKRRNGYDLFPYLPALAGKIVAGTEQTDRILWDFRRTIADLFAENYYDYMGELAHQSGLQLSVEPYGDGPFDDIRSGRGVDVPMTEFWVPGPGTRDWKSAAMIAHIYGKTLVGAESFTGEPKDARWQQSPQNLKALGDFAFTCGINHMSFHRMAHQPWLDRFPGLSGPWGSNFDRTNTWWEQGAAWIRYLTRCQSLLQQGRFVADALVFGGEGSPAAFPGAPGGLPAGYDWDGCNADVLLHRVAVQNGRLILPDGMNYRVLVLEGEATMTPELLNKVRELALAGATIIGPKPGKSPSFRGYPQCDAQVRNVADELWDSGKISSRSVGETFAAMKLPPDFECGDKGAFLESRFAGPECRLPLPGASRDEGRRNREGRGHDQERRTALYGQKTGRGCVKTLGFADVGW